MLKGLEAVANLVAVLTGVTALVLVLGGPWVRGRVIAWYHWRGFRRLWSRAPAGPVGFRWPVPPPAARDLTVPGLLHRPGGVDDGVAEALSWQHGPERIDEIATATGRFGGWVENSTLARLGSSAQADRDAAAARRAARLLAHDAVHEPLGASERPPQDEAPHPFAPLLAERGVTVLAGPHWAGAPLHFSTGERAGFDGVRVSERRAPQPYGVDGTAQQIARGEGRFCWEGAGLGPEERRLLERRAGELAALDIDESFDAYNGQFPRLLRWRVERAGSQASRRLHLLVGMTTFYTWRLFNDAAAAPLPAPLAARRVVVDRQGGGIEGSVGGAHLPIAISLVTADRRLVLRRRSRAARLFPGQWETAANGNAEIGTVEGAHSDRDGDGLVDFATAGQRELLEEMGPVPLTGPPRCTGLVIVDDREAELGMPYLLMAARTTLTFAQLLDTFDRADPVEGFHESEGDLIGLPLGRGGDVDLSVAHLLAAPQLRLVALAASLLVCGAEGAVRIDVPPPGPERVAEWTAWRG